MLLFPRGGRVVLVWLMDLLRLSIEQDNMTPKSVAEAHFCASVSGHRIAPDLREIKEWCQLCGANNMDIKCRKLLEGGVIDRV